jgi:hypothetical protein
VIQKKKEGEKERSEGDTYVGRSTVGGEHDASIVLASNDCGL